MSDGAKAVESSGRGYGVERFDAPPMGIETGLTVRRERLLRELAFKAGEAGIALVCAPKGFGKTTLLFQYAATVRSDPERGSVELIDAGRMAKHELRDLLEEIGQGQPVEARPLIAIDDVPRLEKEEARRIADLLRALRGRGFEVVASCLPSNRALLSTLGDSAKIAPPALAVQPGEYAQWARAFSIAPSLDVYELTQGVPALVVQLQDATGAQMGGSLLEAGIEELYQGVMGELRRERDSLYRIVCLMLLMGSGSFEELERSGLRVRQETRSRLARDYPVFALGGGTGSFGCLGDEDGAGVRLRRDIAARRPEFATQAVRLLIRAGRVDAAVRLIGLVLDSRAAAGTLAQFPVHFALAGHAAFVSRVFAEMGRVPAAGIETGALLAVYTAALTAGEYHNARRAAVELRRRADEIPQQVDPADWGVARALSEAWGPVSGTELPELDRGFSPEREPRAAARLRAHARGYRELIGGSGAPLPAEAREAAPSSAADNALDVPGVLLATDRCLESALRGDGVVKSQLDDLEDLAEVLAERRLVPLSVRVRMTASACRMLAGLPVTDERGFVDAGTMAVREGDLATQLFCLAAEGWQALALKQTVTAQFRGQQVLKLAEPGQSFLRSWGTMLERTSYLRGTSRVKIREDAEALDLYREDCGPAEAWAVAMHLAAARFDSELSAWFSLNKAVMLEPGFRPIARHALALLGARCESLRSMIPRGLLARYVRGDEAPLAERTLFEVVNGTSGAEAGQVVINLFGGFHAERNGHVLTDEIWRRKKTSVVAARLTLSLGSFVSRRTIIDELWPDAGYSRGRESLYVTLSSLRRALGQREEGLQYLLTQGDGVALNGELIYSDVRRFDGLAREILLSGEDATSPQIVEASLKMEQLYTGPLYLPDCGDPSFFARMRRAFATRFVDCMVRGIDAALAAENLSSASWLVESALRHAPAREDLIRRAMSVYDLCGRRRELVELYNGHLHYLKNELGAVPEPETRAAYERIVDRSRKAVMM